MSDHKNNNDPNKSIKQDVDSQPENKPAIPKPSTFLGMDQLAKPIDELNRKYKNSDGTETYILKDMIHLKANTISYWSHDCLRLLVERKDGCLLEFTCNSNFVIDKFKELPLLVKITLEHVNMKWHIHRLQYDDTDAVKHVICHITSSAVSWSHFMDEKEREALLYQLQSKSYTEKYFGRMVLKLKSYKAVQEIPVDPNFKHKFVRFAVFLTSDEKDIVIGAYEANNEYLPSNLETGKMYIIKNCVKNRTEWRHYDFFVAAATTFLPLEVKVE